MTKNILKVRKENIYYDGLPADMVVENFTDCVFYKGGCAYAMSWHYEYIENVKYLAITYNVEDQFVFDKLYALDGKINEELQALLEETGAIRLCDGNIDLDRILMHNFTFDLEPDQINDCFRVENLFPNPDSYRENLGAFYNIHEIFERLAGDSGKITGDNIELKRQDSDIVYNGENVIIRALESEDC